MSQKAERNGAHVQQGVGWFAMRSLARALLIATLSGTTAAAQHMSERIEVRVVNVDVVVTDRAGNRISGLAREKFRLYEDGKPVEVSYFSRYVDGQLALDPAVAATPEAQAIPDVRVPVTWAVMIDQTGMRPAMRNHALRQLREFLGSAIAGGDRAMLTVVDGQAFRVTQNITTDRSLLVNALSAVERESVHLGPAMTEAAAIRRDITWVEPTDPEIRYLARTIGARISSLILQETRRTRNAFAAMRALLTALTRVDGRVALLYVGSGFNTLPGADLAQAWSQAFAHVPGISWSERPNPEDHQSMLDPEIDELYGHLSASRVTVYTIQPGDSTTMSADDPGLVITQQTVEGGRASEGEILGDRSEIRQTSLSREIAASTGGRSFRVSSALAKQLDVVRYDFNDYYALGYVPRGDSPKTRKIKVEVDVPGARVLHRNAVRERTRLEEAGYDVLVSRVEPPRKVIATPLKLNGRTASTASAESTNPFGVAVAVEQPRRIGRREHELPFRFNTRIDTLSFVKGDRSLRADLVFFFALVGPDGTMWPLESREQALEIPVDQIPATKDVMSSSWHLDLTPLRIPSTVPMNRQSMRLNVQVVDRASLLRSVVTVPVPRG